MLGGCPRWGAFGGEMKKTLVVVICICFVFISCTKKEQTKIEQNSEVEKDETIIFNNDIREEDSLEVLGRVVENSRCTLKCLVLSENDLSSSNLPNGYLSYFFNSLKRNTSLVEILMLNCNIRNDNVDDICNMLTENKKLEKLCLYNNMIDNPTKFLKILSVFCGPNPRNNTLKELDLSKNKCKLSINDEFLKIIKNLQIDSLDISQNFELTNTADAEKFRKVASDVQNKIKIIY